MGFDKLAAQWRGKTILWHSVHAFSSLEEIAQVIVVTPPDRFAWLADLGPKLNRINGGRERSDSVAAGLMALKNEISHVAIHDGAPHSFHQSPSGLPSLLLKQPRPRASHAGLPKH